MSDDLRDLCSPAEYARLVEVCRKLEIPCP